MDNEAEEIIRARRLFEEFEKSPGLSKKSCFKEAITILDDFLTQQSDSEFSQRANNLKSIYTKQLIKKLIADFSDLDVRTIMWAIDLWDEIKGVLANDPELEKDWMDLVKR